MDKIVTFSNQNDTIEAWSPLSTGTLGASLANKDSSNLSPINSSSNVSSSNNDEFARPVTPTRHNPFSSTPFILSASTSSPNLLIDKSSQSVFSKYRDSPKSKLANNSVKYQDQVRQLQTQLSSSEQRQDVLEKENADLQRQVKMLQDHITMKESNFNLRIEEAVRIEEENMTLTRTASELRDRLTVVMSKLTETEADFNRITSDNDEKLSQIQSLSSELKSSQSKLAEVTGLVKDSAAEIDRLSTENGTLQQQVKLLENELSAMRTKYQDEHDLLINLERQRDALEDKLRQRERQIDELQSCGNGDAASAAATSQLELHMLSQMESIIAKKFSELAEKLPSQAPVQSAAQSQSISFVPSAPASIAGNDYDDKADSISNNGVGSIRSEMEQYSSLNPADTTVTSNGGVGLGNVGILNNPATSTWKKPSASERAPVLDWLPLEPEDEEMFEEEARWRDREFLKRTAMGAANRKRLIMEEESRPGVAIPTASAPHEDSLHPNDRLSQLAERNRKQPMHMRSAYAIEEAAFFIPENDLRTGKTLSIDGLAAVSSTPLHSDQAPQQPRNSVQQLRAPKVPVNRPVSMYASGSQPRQVSHQPPPSSIPKPTQMVFSPPTRSNGTPQSAAKGKDSVASSSISMSSSTNENKENTKLGSSALMIISPPPRNNKGTTGIAKPVEPEQKPKGLSGAAFVISPPQKNPAPSAVQKQQEQAAAARKAKSTSTPKKFLGAVARAFGSSSKNTGGDQMKTDL